MKRILLELGILIVGIALAFTLKTAFMNAATTALDETIGKVNIELITGDKVDEPKEEEKADDSNADSDNNNSDNNNSDNNNNKDKDNGNHKGWDKNGKR